jgi:septum formation topological specificity factor MinE
VPENECYCPIIAAASRAVDLDLIATLQDEIVAVVLYHVLDISGRRVETVRI